MRREPFCKALFMRVKIPRGALPRPLPIALVLTNGDSEFSTANPSENGGKTCFFFCGKINLVSRKNVENKTVRNEAAPSPSPLFSGRSTRRLIQQYTGRDVGGGRSGLVNLASKWRIEKGTENKWLFSGRFARAPNRVRLRLTAPRDARIRFFVEFTLDVRDLRAGKKTGVCRTRVQRECFTFHRKFYLENV